MSTGPRTPPLHPHPSRPSRSRPGFPTRPPGDALLLILLVLVATLRLPPEDS